MLPRQLEMMLQKMANEINESITLVFILVLLVFFRTCWLDDPDNDGIHQKLDEINLRVQMIEVCDKAIAIKQTPTPTPTINEFRRIRQEEYFKTPKPE